MKNNRWKIITKIITERLVNLNLEEDHNQNASETVLLDQQLIGRISRMDALQNQAMAKALDLRKKNEKKALIEALNRIKRGDYGECIECGDEISFQRLKVNPAVFKCADCMKN
tara:strand:- start:538 stop:876 length:339 start_codon:yes stop_codon:yes gene_type:complete